MANNRHMKIGFIFDDASSSWQTCDLLQRLDKIDGLDITLIQNRFEGANRFGIKRKLLEYGPLRFFNKTLFALYSALETRLAKGRPSEDESPGGGRFAERIKITPLPSRKNLVYRYTSEDIEKIADMQLDLLVRGDGRGIYKGDILNVARDGFLSLHYGDNRIFRGVPAGFWEVYHREQETGFIIQLLNEVLDGGQVLARGKIATRATHSENWIAVSDAAHRAFEVILKDYANGRGLPNVEKNEAPLGKLLTTPNVGQLFNYIRKIFT